MGGAADVEPAPDLGLRIIKGLLERSREQADLPPTSEEGTRSVVLTRRLYDPDFDFLSAPRVDEEYSSKRLDESTMAHRAYSRTKREPKKRGLATSHDQRFAQLKPAIPPLQQPPASREGGQIAILKRGEQLPQLPQQLQAYPGKGEDTHMVPQPENRPISPEQLIAEIKRIYAGLVSVEAKCSEVSMPAGYQPKLNNERWRAPIALHRTLLHSHSDVCPEGEYDQHQLRAYREELCYRKLSDTSARHEPQQPPPPNLLPTPVRWRVLDMAPDSRGQNFASRPDPREPGGISWGAGNSDVREIERGTSHTTLHQPDTPKLPVSLRSNVRKRTSPDSSPAERSATPAPHDASRDDRSPKRPRPQSAAPPWRALGPIRGNSTSAIKRPSSAGHLDPEFDRSQYQVDLSPTNEKYTPTRPVALPPRPCDPYSDLPGAPASRGGGQITPEPGGQHSQPPQQPQTYPGKGEDTHMFAQSENRPTSPEQLIAEVKGISAGLVSVEAALIALRRTLLHEHYDSSASRRPSASTSPGRLAPKYSVPARVRRQQRGRNLGWCCKSHNRKINRGKRCNHGR